MIELLRLFGKELRQDVKTDTKIFNRVNGGAIKKGYLVTMGACTEDTVAYLDEIDINPNATFYAAWEDVLSKNRIELLMDQLYHYASTYGTNYEGTPYIPNNIDIDLPYKELKVIDTMSLEEAQNRILTMVYSSMPMKDNTLDDIISVLKGLSISHLVDIDTIRNRELKLRMYELQNTVPSDPEELVKYIVYRATGSTLVIKSREALVKLKSGFIALSDFINKDNISEISSVFYRYKAIFLALKHTHDGNAEVVNKLRRLAKRNHKPMKAPFWNTCFEQTLFNIAKYVDDLSNFKKIALINTINARFANTDSDYQPYIIRNGKIFIKEGSHFLKKEEVQKYSQIRDILYESLIRSIRQKKVTVKYNHSINLTLPTSEKTFIGNYPMYSSIKMDIDTIIGIYWKEKWGASDLDLSFIRAGDFTKIGWDSCYFTNASIIFSGDMTSARPEATELLYFKKDEGLAERGLVRVNNYNGENNSKFNLFVAKEKIEERDFKKNYMCDPNNIILKAECFMDSNDKFLGITYDKTLYLATLRFGNNIVSRGSGVADGYSEYISRSAKSMLTLNDVLKDAGFEDTIIDPDLDFTDPTKDMFMKLLS